ncbi:hypothetical protein G6F32_016124 [Rhizopus arrhizus]|nr:hypothetical protein G6F32_016124 [Rhizopus arrhizus]
MLPPLAVGIDRLDSSSSWLRSSAGPRSSISIWRLPSRYTLTDCPASELDRNWLTWALLTPSARARSWSITSRTTLLGSLQSRLTFITCGFSRTLASTWRAIACTLSMCSPEMRICTG